MDRDSKLNCIYEKLLEIETKIDMQENDKNIKKLENEIKDKQLHLDELKLRPKYLKEIKAEQMAMFRNIPKMED